MNEEGIKVSARPILVLTCFYLKSKLTKFQKSMVVLYCITSVISLNIRKMLQKHILIAPHSVVVGYDIEKNLAFLMPKTGAASLASFLNHGSNYSIP